MTQINIYDTELLNLIDLNALNQNKSRQTNSIGPKTPALVFLHGFLGLTRDWLPVVENLTLSSACFAIELPGHGQSKNTELEIENGFEHFNQLLINTLIKNNITHYILVGYSLGGRLAAYHACKLATHSEFLKSTLLEKTLLKSNKKQSQKIVLHGLILESCNLGLATAQQKKVRWQHDKAWVNKFAQQPLIESLNEWYQQGVFSSLSKAQKQMLITSKIDQSGKQMSKMLAATSLAKQQLLISNIEIASIPVYYLYGNKDEKYQKIADHIQKSVKNTQTIKIDDAGHNCHFEQVALFANTLSELYKKINN